MRYGTSFRLRHIVGKIDKGEDLIDSLTLVCQRENIRAAQIHITGLLTSASIQEWDTDKNEYFNIFKGDCAMRIVSMNGNVSLFMGKPLTVLYATLKTTAYGAPLYFSGLLKCAKAHSIEFFIEEYSDLEIERTFNPRTGLPLWSRIENFDDSDVNYSLSSFPAAMSNSSAPFAEEHLEKKKMPEVVTRSVAAIPFDSIAFDTDASEIPPVSRPASELPVADNDSTEILAKKNGRKVIRYEEPSSLQENDIVEHPTLGTCTVKKVVDKYSAIVEIAETSKSIRLSLAIFKIVHIKDRNFKLEKA